MDDPRDPKLSKEKQIFTYITNGVKGNMAPPMRHMGIGKRTREHSRASNENVELVEKVSKLESKVDDLWFAVGLIYKMLTSKELGVCVEEVKLQTRSVESQKEAPHRSLEVDLINVTSPSGVHERVDEVSERIDLVIQDLNISIDPIFEEDVAE